MWDRVSEGDRVRNYFTSSDGDIRYIFAPFIQKQAFEEVIPDGNVDTIIVTRWRHVDLISGVSDPDLFETAREYNYTLKIHPQIHAKVYSWDLESALVGSANLTKSGMGSSNNSNIEVLLGPTQLPLQTQLNLRKAEKEAQLVSREDYEKAVEVIETTRVREPDYDTIDIGRDPEYLISQLPMTEDPDLIINVLSRDNSTTLDDVVPDIRRCVLHDISTYSLYDLKGRPQTEVQNGLREGFEKHGFISMIMDHMNPCIYFGEMKALVQEKCADVPTPSRRELTGNVQVLYNWFPRIAPERFKHDVPGRHSERLCDSRKSNSM